MISMNDKIDELGKKFSTLQKKMDIQKLNSCKSSNEVISSTKDQITAIYKGLQIMSEHKKNQFYSKLLKAQKGFEDQKKEITQSINTVKAKGIKLEEKAAVDNAMEYAAFSIDNAMLAIEEATLAFYDAVEKAEGYIDKYPEADLLKYK